MPGSNGRDGRAGGRAGLEGGGFLQPAADTAAAAGPAPAAVAAAVAAVAAAVAAAAESTTAAEPSPCAVSAPVAPQPPAIPFAAAHPVLLPQPAPAAPGVQPAHGRAVQVDPIKPMLKPPGTKRLKYNMLDRLQTLLSSSTCAATSRR